MDLAETPWIPTLRFVLEIAATAAFALSGMIAAARQRMDAVGVCVVACVAAFGGGTLRDLLLDPSQDRGLFNPAMLDRLLTDPQGQLTPLRGSKLWQLAALNLWLSEQGI